MHISFSRLGTLVLSSFLIFPGLALGQQPVGVVTALKGKARLTRATTQTALAFKNGIILRDINKFYEYTSEYTILRPPRGHTFVDFLDFNIRVRPIRVFYTST